MAVDITPILTGGAQATGLITNQTAVVAYLGSLNVAMLSTQDANSTGTTINVPLLQNAIDWAESRIISKLANFFQVPLTIAGVAVLNAGTWTLDLLQEIANRFVAHYLNEWRQVQSADGSMTVSDIDAKFKLLEMKSVADLNQINRYANGYSDGLFVLLDLLATAPAYLAKQNGGAIPAIRGFRAQPRWGYRGSLVGQWC